MERATSTASITRKSSSRSIASTPTFITSATLSRCQDDWQGCRGYVQDHVREIVRGRPDMIAYICGLNDMVDHNRKMLMEEMGWDRKQIVFERYD